MHNGIVIHKLDHEQPAIRAAIFDFLASYETRTLFILGNLNAGLPDQHLYAASREGKWVGVAGYYGLPRSLIPFALDPEVTRALVAHAAASHPQIDWLNGPGDVARPALEELAECGYEPTCPPWQFFMEAELPDDAAIPRCEHEQRVRLIRPDDAPQVARLIRWMRRPEDLSPATDREIELCRMNALRMVLEVDGRIVSTASTNGIGIRAFQILAVLTDPAFRRQGYARSTCAALMRMMRQHGAERCALFTDVNNAPAQRVYESLGFRITGDYVVAPLARVKPA